MTGLDTALLILIVVGALALAGAVLVLGQRGARARAEREQAARDGRIAAMIEAQNATTERLTQRLIEQERVLGERLGDVARRVGESLEKTSDKTNATMTDLRERLARIDAAQKAITELSTQVVGLQDILDNKQARGAFGEIQLNDLVSAVLPPSTYSFQAPVGDNRRVDCLLRLPNPPGPICIDAKFPLEAYHAIRNAKTEAEATMANRAFATAIRTHVRDIGEKYIVPGETAEAALMFLPSEAVYAELHANFPAVVEDSFRAHVFIVSPTTLWATLNTVRAVFKDVRMREQTHVIQKEIQLVLTDVGRLDRRVEKLEGHFNLARRDIDDIRVSTTKITRRAQRIEEIEFEEAGDDAPEALPGAE